MTTEPATPNAPARLPETASQTAGPYVHIGLLPNAVGLPMFGGRDLGATLAGPDCEGRRIAVTGRVLDGFGAPCRDAVVECWHADPEGRFPPHAAPGFRGFGRSGCDGDGRWRFETVAPGPVPFADGRMQAPHLSLIVFARGINLGLHTRLYLPDPDPADPVLSRIDPPERAATLIAASDEADDDTLTLDIRLQGEGETVFLDV